MRQVEYDSLWVYGGVDDTLLHAPSVLRGFDDGLYVYDVGSQMVTRFDQVGNVQWSWGQHGEGPGELLRARTMTRSPDGGVAIVDSGNRRVVWITEAGDFKGESAIGEVAGSIEDVVALGSGRYVLETTGPSWPVLSASGEFQTLAEFPWDQLSTMSSLQRQGEIAHARDDRWVFAFRYGNGWLRFDGAIAQGASPFVEQERPRLRCSCVRHRSA